MSLEKGRIKMLRICADEHKPIIFDGEKEECPLCIALEDNAAFFEAIEQAVETIADLKKEYKSISDQLIEVRTTRNELLEKWTHLKKETKEKEKILSYDLEEIVKSNKVLSQSQRDLVTKLTEVSAERDNLKKRLLKKTHTEGACTEKIELDL